MPDGRSLMPTPPELVQGYSREPDGRWEQVRRYVACLPGRWELFAVNN